MMHRHDEKKHNNLTATSTLFDMVSPLLDDNNDSLRHSEYQYSIPTTSSFGQPSVTQFRDQSPCAAS